MTEVTGDVPPRPLIPLVASFALGLTLASLTVLHCSASAFLSLLQTPPLLLVAVAGGLAALLSGCALFRLQKGTSGRKAAAVTLLLAGLGLGCVSSSLWSTARFAESSYLDAAPVSSMLFCIEDDPSISDTGYSYPASVTVGGSPAGRVRLVLDRDVPVGTKVTAIGRTAPFKNDEWGRSRYYHGELCRVSAVRVKSVVPPGLDQPLRMLRARLLSAIDPSLGESRALVAGIVCGRSSEINAGELGEFFSQTGVAHLIAVSGSHLALVGFLVDDTLSRFHVKRRTRSISVAICSLLFALLTGSSPSAMRSCVMVSLGLASRAGGRRAHGVSSLAIAMSLFILLDPAVVFDLGFRLSCASVAAILLFGDYACRLLESCHVPPAIASVVAISVITQMMSLPFTVPAFGRISLLSPLSNAVMAPLITFLLASGVACAPIALVPALSGAALTVPVLAARTAIFAVTMLSRVPGASAPVALEGWVLYVPWALFLMLYLAWPLPRPRMVVGVIAVAAIVLGFPLIYWNRFAPAAATVLDVGQADSILVREGPHTLLIDCGVDSRALEGLVRNNVGHLDAVLVTHWDDDHWGGLPYILETVPVDRILVARGAKAQAPDELKAMQGKIEELDRGDILSIGNFRARVVWPDSSVDGLDNEDSLVLDLEYVKNDKRLSMLLTGDAELEQEMQFADSVGDIDVLKCGHHGSKKSVDRKLLSVLTPELAVASAGEGNRYGHPSSECVEAAADAGARFLCTIESGDICIEPADGGFEVRCQKAPAA